MGLCVSYNTKKIFIPQHFDPVLKRGSVALVQLYQQASDVPLLDSLCNAPMGRGDFRSFFVACFLIFNRS